MNRPPRPARAVAFAALGALALATLPGCNELLGFGAFTIGDASVARDGGMDASSSPTDGGRRDAAVDGGGTDAGCFRTWYRDDDGDGFGDPTRTMSSCTQPANHVDNGDDCDDDDDMIRPGETEICDTLDQDCDGAIDEGLFGPIGALIPVVDDLGIGFNHGEAALVTTTGGHAVAYRRFGVDAIYASFYDHAGNALMSDVYVGGRVSVGADASELAATRYTVAGLDSIVFGWREETRIAYRLFTPTGETGLDNRALTIDAADVVRSLRVRQHGDRLLFSWTDDLDQRHLVSVDRGIPATGDYVLSGGTIQGTLATDPTTILIAEATDPAILGPDGGLVDAEGVGLDGGLPPGLEFVPPEIDFRPLVGSDSFTLGSPQPWDASARCAATGLPICLPIVAMEADNVSPGETGAAIIELVIGFDGMSSEASWCMFPVSIDSTGRYTVEGACVELPAAADLLGLQDTEARGTVITNVVASGVGSAVALVELPLTAEAEGASTLLPLTGIEPLYLASGLSVRDAHGGFIGDSPARSADDLVLQRLGCVP